MQRRHLKETATPPLLSARRHRLVRSSSRHSRPLLCERLENRLLLSVTAQEQEMVYLLNLARHDPAAYQQEQNLSVDLSGVAPQPPLAVNDQLFASAGFHAGEMAAHNYFDHQSHVTGDWPNKMARDHGYPLPSSWDDNANYIESIAAGTYYYPAVVPLNALIVDEGIDPPGHRIHLLGTSAFHAGNREIGVGYAFNASSYYDHYWAIHATRSDTSDTFATGVVFNDANGNLRYEAGEGLAGVTVTVGTDTTTTNAAGGWSVQVAPGDYVVTASGGAFEGTSVAQITVDSQSVEVDFISGRAWGLVDFDDNMPPSVADDFYLASSDAVLSIPAPGVLANDTDPESDPLTAVPAGPPGHGALQLRADGSFDYTPGPGFAGTDTFTYRAGDGSVPSLEATVTVEVAQPLGTVDFAQLEGLDLAASDRWYSLRPTRAGFLTLEAWGGDVGIQLYTPEGGQLDTSSEQGGVQRLDWTAPAADDLYYVHLTGTGTNIGFRATNLVAHVGSAVSVAGTAGPDHFEYAPDAAHRVAINGVEYLFEEPLTSVAFAGDEGADTATLRGSAAGETLVISPHSATLTRVGFELSATGTTEVVAVGGGGTDTAFMYGSAGADAFIGRSSYGLLLGEGGAFSNRAVRFGEVHVYGEGGGDTAKLYDTQGDERLAAGPNDATFSGPGFLHHVLAFPDVRAFAASGGSDEADLYDSPGDDYFTGRLDRAVMEAGGCMSYAEGFGTVRAHSSGEAGDTALLVGLPGDDEYVGTAVDGTLRTQDGLYTNAALAFPIIHVLAKAGQNDVAYLHGTVDKDRFRGTQVYGRLTGPRDDGGTFFHRAVRFDELYALSNGGDDVAQFYDSSYNDELHATPNSARQYNSRLDQTASDFRYVYAYADEGGSDTARLTDYSPADTLIQDPSKTILYSDSYYVRVEGHETIETTPIGGGEAAAIAAPVPDPVAGSGSQMETSASQLPNRLVGPPPDEWLRSIAGHWSRVPQHDKTEAVDRTIEAVDAWLNA